MRLLVTGASGFAGTHLCAALRRRDHEVLTLGTDPASDYRVDVRAHDDVRAAAEHARPDGVFHLAAVAFVPAAEADPALADAVNHLGTCNVLDGAYAVGARTLMVSSGAVYGRASEAELPLNEDHALAPVGAYARSKAAAEQACTDRADRQEVVRVRPFNQTGPGQAPQYVCSDFASQVAAYERDPTATSSIEVGDLRAERDFTDVRDAVEGYVDAWERGVPGDVYNVCSGRPVAVQEVLDVLLALSRVDVDVRVRGERLRPGEVSRYYGTPRKLTAVTGWRPGRLLEQTLSDLLEDWRKRLAEPGDDSTGGKP